MRPRAGSLTALGLALLAWASAVHADPATPQAASQAPRIEAHSANFTAVGIVHGERLSIHLSRRIDNSPVHDAVVTVTLRGAAHPAVAEADGSYSVQSTDLAIPGAASLQLSIAQGSAHEEMSGILEQAAAPKPEGDKNSARQLWWWVLNFAVCIGFLKLWSQRRKAAAEREAAEEAASRD